MTRRLLLAALALAAAGTINLYDAQIGQRIGTAKENPSGSIDVFRPDGSRAGWGRQNPDGSAELFAPDGSRLGIVTRDGRAIWLDKGKRKQ